MAGARQCPLCDQPTDQELCAEHLVPTLDPAMFERAPVSPELGVTIANRYRIERLLGQGGMATVFVARQLGVNRQVAVKMVRPDRKVDLPLVKRFYREARAISGLNHPNIVQLFEFGIDPATRLPFLAMEFVEGLSLAQIFDSAVLSERRAAHLIAQVCRALSEAHGAGIVHRDLKPDNIMVTRLRDGEEHVKVLDFGLAKLLRGDQDGLTAPGRTVGTPHYMAPEQAIGQGIDYRSDLYSIGCMLFEGLTGNPPFDSPQLKVLLDKHIHDPRPPLPDTLRDGHQPSEAMRVVQGALLKKKKDDRPASGTVVATILAGIARGDTPDATALLAVAKLELSGSTRSMPTAAAGEELVATIPQVVPSEWLQGSSGDLTISTPPNPDMERPDPTQILVKGLERRALLHAETIPPAPQSQPADPALLRPVSVSGPREPPIPVLGARPPASRAVWLLSLALALVSGVLVWSLARAPESAPLASSVPHDPKPIARETAIIARPTAVQEPPSPPVIAPLPPSAPSSPAHPAPAVHRPSKASPSSNPSAPVTPAAPAGQVKIVSQPAEAEVLNETDAVIGKTPLSLGLRAPATLRIRKPGFIERKIAVQPGEGEVLVKLHAQW